MVIERHLCPPSKDTIKFAIVNHGYKYYLAHYRGSSRVWPERMKDAEKRGSSIHSSSIANQH
jgi:hypothetical protein